MTPFRHWPHVWREWVFAYDPALAHLWRTVRGTVAIAATLAASTQVARAMGQPPSIAILGSVVALLGSMLVNDPTPTEQRTTIMLMALSAAIAVVIGALVASNRVLGDIIFVIVTFVATWLRRFGARGFALGMVAFIPYFLALLLQPKLAAFPPLLLGIAIGAACALLMRFVILPDQPRRELRYTLYAVRANVSQLLDSTGRAVDTGHWTRWRRGQVRRRMNRLNVTVLAAEAQLDGAADVRIHTDMQPSQLRLCLFSLELAAERVVSVALRNRPTEMQSHRADVWRMRHGGRGAPGDKSSRLARPLAALHEALDALPPATAVEIRPDPKPSSADDGAPESGMRPSTRQAIQVAIASAVAVGTGEMVSPHRWYWAVIAAFVVFNGTRSRGETIFKSWQRLLGTLGGVLAGVLVATAVHGSRDLSIGLIFLCIFLAFYSIRGAYALFIFWLTILLALLYGLLGHFTPDLLLVRLEETALGAGIGVLVASVVLPVSTGNAYEKARGHCLQSLADLVETCNARIIASEVGRDPIGKARALDRCLQELQTKARPLTAGLHGMARRNRVRETVRSLRATAYYGRNLVWLSGQVRPSPELARALHAVGDRLCRNARALAGGEASIESVGDGLAQVNERLPEGEDEQARYLVRVFRLLAWIDRVLVRLSGGES